MALQAQIDALTKHGWKEGQAKTTFTHPDRPGEAIHVSDDGAGYQHYDKDGNLIGHSRYHKSLEAHVAQVASTP